MKKLKQLTMRFGKMIFGFVLIAIGIFFAKYSGLGLSPWDLMNDGVANALNITLGQASIVVGIAFLVLTLSCMSAWVTVQC